MVRFVGEDWSGLMDPVNLWECYKDYRGTPIVVKDREVDGQVQRRYLVGGYTQKGEKQYWEIGSWDLCVWLGEELEPWWTMY